jgi:hypothetical protein
LKLGIHGLGCKDIAHCWVASLQTRKNFMIAIIDLFMTGFQASPFPQKYVKIFQQKKNRKLINFSVSGFFYPRRRIPSSNLAVTAHIASTLHPKFIGKILSVQ